MINFIVVLVICKSLTDWFVMAKTRKNFFFGRFSFWWESSFILLFCCCFKTTTRIMFFSHLFSQQQRCCCCFHHHDHRGNNFCFVLFRKWSFFNDENIVWKVKVFVFGCHFYDDCWFLIFGSIKLSKECQSFFGQKKKKKNEWIQHFDIKNVTFKKWKWLMILQNDKKKLYSYVFFQWKIFYLLDYIINGYLNDDDDFHILSR